MQVETRHADGFSIVEVVGEIEFYAADTLRDAVTELIAARHYHLIIDLTHVDFVDSTGLGVLAGAFKKTRAQGGSLQLVGAQEQLLGLCRVTGLVQVFTFRDSMAEATSQRPTAP